MSSPAVSSVEPKKKISRCCPQRGVGLFHVIDVFHSILILKVQEKLREERGQQYKPPQFKITLNLSAKTKCFQMYSCHSF